MSLSPILGTVFSDALCVVEGKATLGHRWAFKANDELHLYECPRCLVCLARLFQDKDRHKGLDYDPTRVRLGFGSQPWKQRARILKEAL